MSDLIKLWIDDERAMLPVKMSYPVTKAIIDQAHKHKLKVWAHVYYLDDAKELVRQGVDGFCPYRARQGAWTRNCWT